MDAHRLLRKVRKAIESVDNRRKRVNATGTNEVLFFEVDNTGAYAQYAVYVRPSARKVRLVVYYEEPLFDYVLDILRGTFTIEKGKTRLEYDKNGWEVVISQPHSHK